MYFKRSASAMAALTICSSLVFLPMAAKRDTPDPLTDDTLKTTLENMGYAPTALSKGYLIVTKRDTWTYNMQLLLSDNQTKLGLNANLGMVDNPDDITATQWRT